MIRFAVAIAAGYVLLCAAAYIFQNRLIFFPAKTKTPDPERWGISARRVRIPSGGSELGGLWASGGSSPYTLLWCHGNAGCVADRVAEFRDFAAAGFNLLLFDYRGYGDSPGRPTGQSFLEDALAAYDYLVSQGVDGRTIVPYGRSLGSAPAAFLANRRPVAGLILVQPLTSLADVGKKAYPYLPVRLLLREKLDNLKELRRFEGSLLVLHGDEDDIVPFEMGRRCFQAGAGENKVMVTLFGAGHNGIGATHGEEIRGAIGRWLSGLKPVPGEPGADRDERRAEKKLDMEATEDE